MLRYFCCIKKTVHLDIDIDIDEPVLTTWNGINQTESEKNINEMLIQYGYKKPEKPAVTRPNQSYWNKFTIFK
jgi:hypothetical protein